MRSGVFATRTCETTRLPRQESIGSGWGGAIDSASQFTQPPDARWSSILPNPRSPVTPVERLPFLDFPSSTRRSEEHTSELQSRGHLVCRLLLEKKKKHHKLLQS